MLWIAACLSALPLSVSAETIVLKSGQTVNGKVIEQTDTYIKLDVAGIPVTYFKEEIESMPSEAKPSKDGAAALSTAPMEAGSWEVSGVPVPQAPPAAEAGVDSEGILPEGLAGGPPKGNMIIPPRRRDGSYDFEKALSVLEGGKMEDNEKAARTAIATFVAACESYRDVAEQYPQKEEDLTNTDPPYLAETLDGKIKQGYVFHILFSQGRYEIVAKPMKCQETGRLVFVAETGSELTENTCP